MRKWFVWIVFGPAILGSGLVIWIALSSSSRDPLLTIILLAIAVPSLVLLIRMVRQRATEVTLDDPAWTLSGPHFDYIISTAIGLPIVLIVAFSVLFIAGRL